MYAKKYESPFDIFFYKSSVSTNSYDLQPLPRRDKWSGGVDQNEIIGNFVLAKFRPTGCTSINKIKFCCFPGTSGFDYYKYYPIAIPV